MAFVEGIAVAGSELLDASDAPELICDFAIHRKVGEMIRIYLCRTLAADPDRYEIVGVVFMPASGWKKSHEIAHELARPKGH